MSDYLRALCPVAKSRYLEKLSALGLGEKDDPYAVSNLEKFVDDMSCWPNIEYSNIFIYFIERPGVYIRRDRWCSIKVWTHITTSRMATSGG